MKLIWDAVASEFGSRHELYERNYAGNWEEVRLQKLMGATMTGDAEAFKAVVDHCLSEYDMDGWKIPGMVNPDDVNVFTARRQRAGEWNGRDGGGSERQRMLHQEGKSVRAVVSATNALLCVT